MPKQLKIALAQVNVTVGDIKGNLAKILQFWESAKGVDLVVFPELAITGYPAEDLVLRPSFQKEAMAAARKLARETAKGPAIITGALWLEKGRLHNTALFMEKGEIRHIQPKYELPNYGVFDEKRHFTPGPLPKPVAYRGLKLGIMVCEDMWHEAVAKALRGADVVLSINASPFEHGKQDARRKAARNAAKAAGCPLLYVNMMCGQDDIVFDGDSFVMTEKGSVACRAPQFEEALLEVAFTRKKESWQCLKKSGTKPLSREAQHYHAMVVGLRDYVTKNRFPGVVLGLSGGIDSALSAAVAVDALGPEKVQAIMLPSRFTSEESFVDAAECARRLGIRLDEVPIEGLVKEAHQALSGLFAGTKPDVTEENIQSRFRGLLLMALSNKFGHMVLTTGNKSEISTGYATLYGDMCGGYNVLKDTYKTEVYALSHWRNGYLPKDALGPGGEVIPKRVITKAPTAELRPGQKDEDSLPPYAVLDAILDGLVEKELSLKEIVAEGHEKAVVEKVARLVYNAEYKRRQSAPGVKVTGRSFGRDRRYPITNGFKE